MKLSISHYDGEMNRRLTVGVLMTTELRSSVNWEVLANIKPRSVLKSNSPSSFLEASYPHPRREFKLLKREIVYNFDVMKFNIKCLGGNFFTS